MMLHNLSIIKNASRVVLEVKKENGRAIYKKCGYKKKGDLNNDLCLTEWVNNDQFCYILSGQLGVLLQLS